MLALSFIRKHPEAVRAGAAAKGRPLDVNRLLACDARRRCLVAEATVDRGARAELRDVSRELAGLLAAVPNLPCPGAPARDGGGNDASASAEGDASHGTEARRWGRPLEFDFPPRPHWELARPLGVDEEAAARCAGARFALLKGPAARLERALAALALDAYAARGYVEVSPPLVARADALFASAHLPAYADGMYEVRGGGAGRGGGLFLAPSPEPALLSLARGRALVAGDLPLRYVSCAPCFHATTAGAGRPGRGLFRRRQFTAVHALCLSVRDGAGRAAAELIDAAEAVLRSLELPYRVVVKPAARLSLAAAAAWGLEAWFPAAGEYREVAACAAYGPFLARRARIRVRPRPGARSQLAHVAASAGPVVGRLLAALLENRQRRDGGVDFPTALEPYLRAPRGT